jgi:hypothetical protein
MFNQSQNELCAHVFPLFTEAFTKMKGKPTELIKSAIKTVKTLLKLENDLNEMKVRQISQKLGIIHGPI